MNIERVFYATTEGGEQVEVTLSSLMNAKWDSSGLLVRTASSLGMVEIKAGSIEDERTNAISAEYDDLLNMYEKDTETLRAENARLAKDEKAVDEIMRRWLKYTGVELCDNSVSIAWQCDNSIVGLRAERDALLQEREEAVEIHSRIMSEECPSDEYHCTCVPALRQELAEMKAERDALKAVMRDVITMCDNTVLPAEYPEVIRQTKKFLRRALEALEVK